MNSDVADKLEALRDDYRQVVGSPFEHFYCPILFRDEPVELCRGHIFNRELPATDRSWTVQRADVDSFFGTMFEADFVTLELRGKHSPINALIDPRLARQLKPKITADGEEVKYYRGDGPVPPGHTQITVSGDGKQVPLIIKMAESDVLAALSQNWEIAIERDIRIATLASVLKSAHLCLFHLLGYRYTLSATGHFLGYDVLGRFFRSHVGQPHQAVLASAPSYFREFQNMARPMIIAPDDLQGSVTDRRMFLCKTDAWPWAMLVFLRTGSSMHAVLVPVFEHEHAIARYLRFLENPEPEFDAHLTVLGPDKWEVSTKPHRFNWPPARLIDVNGLAS